jgi:hypothetical protein
MAQYAVFSRATLLTLKAPGALSSYGEMLALSGISDDAREVFETVFFGPQGGNDGLWEQAARAGVPADEIGMLQLQGKLAFLTGGSAPLTTHLIEQRRIRDPVELVGADYHQAETWESSIRELSGNDETALQEQIPPVYLGEKVERRVRLYAEDLARKVRLSYPTQVIARLADQDDDCFRLGAARHETADLLVAAARKGFRLGQTTIDGFLSTHADLAAGLSRSQRAAATTGIRTLHRTYQITPSNGAMESLAALGLKSAHDVTSLSRERFLAQCGNAFPSLDEAELTYARSQQICAVTYNLFATAKALDSQPGVYGFSASESERKAIKEGLINEFPTLEVLFGSLDFCECEHCRSVLSPAAYLVDLLRFIDPDSELWDNSLEHWRHQHNGQKYTEKYLKPYDALAARRPDLPHIALTCENTNTALPYIDLVNEILEYFVANGPLRSSAARDTGDATTEELLAEPQFVIETAYEHVNEAHYPLTLPFDLWTETARELCTYFESPLPELLDVFRPADALFAADAAYDRAAIFMESLGLSPEEAALFADPEPLADWWTLYGASGVRDGTTSVLIVTQRDPQRPTDRRESEIHLSSAKALSRRLGVTYEELVKILETGFANPSLQGHGVLRSLGLSVMDGLFWRDSVNRAFYEQHSELASKEPHDLTEEEKASLEALDPDDRERLERAQAIVQRIDALAGRFSIPLEDLNARILSDLARIEEDKILVLTDPDAGCDFDATTLRYANGTPARPLDFLRINLFVRLWRKVGWTIAETDRALQALVPAETPFDEGWLQQRPLRTALIYFAHLQTLEERLALGKRGRMSLLALWTPIATSGRDSLYARLFLTRGVLKVDPVFDDPLGHYLSHSEPESIASHMLGLQGALGLTADEIGQILRDAEITPREATLSLDNVSLLYRHGLLARGLGLSIAELIALKQLSGFDPFPPLHPRALEADRPGAEMRTTALDLDYPFSRTLRFVELAEAIKDSGLGIADLEYLLRHRFDEAGPYRPDRRGTLAFLKRLADDILAIRAEHAIPADPAAVDEGRWRQKLGLILPRDVVERFLAMMSGTAEFTASETGVSAAEGQAVCEALADEPSLGRVHYQEGRLTLTFRGVLFDLQKELILRRVRSAVLRALLDDVQAQARDFFETNLKKSSDPETRPAFGFLDEDDFAELFAPLPSGEKNQKERERLIADRRTRLAQVFLPVLQRRLVRQLVVQTVTAHTAGEAAPVERLLTDTRVVTTAAPLLDDFAGLSETGATVRIFDQHDNLVAMKTLASADTSLVRQDQNQLAPYRITVATFEGYLEVPVSGAYRFFLLLEQVSGRGGVTGELSFDHLPSPFLVAEGDVTERSDALELEAGLLYGFKLTARGLDAGRVRVLVQGETLPKGDLGRLRLYPRIRVEGAERSLVLLTKIVRLVQALGLGEPEIRYFALHAEHFNDLALGELPTRADEDSPQRATRLFGQFQRLATYARLKRELAEGTDDLIGVFAAPDLDETYQRVAVLTRREPSQVRETARILFGAERIRDERSLGHLWQALKTTESLGVDAATIRDLTGILSRAAEAPDRRHRIARGFKDAIKARFEPETWRRIARPIYDRLRRRQRDALVAYSMNEYGFGCVEELYEYFLIDPGMEPVVQTSRIRMAIGSVQLFVQRCLLNLEPKVPPSVIDARQWNWMKRYRVWEANRKIFLFPENWLEPEFRDNKSHLFRELEGALLQGDVSNDLVEDAFLAYLKKLDELAKLDIVGMHLEDNANPAERVLHVIGRTTNNPLSYFYRRYAHGEWSPWEPMNVGIEGDHIAPVVWRDRLFVFWVTFLPKEDENAQADASPDSTVSLKKPLQEITTDELLRNLAFIGKSRQYEVQLHWTSRVNGAWAPKTSSSPMDVTKGFSQHIYFGPLTLRFLFKSRVFVHVSKEEYENGEERGLYINLQSDDFSFAFYLAGRNSEPRRAAYQKRPINPYTAGGVQANRYGGSGDLAVNFREDIVTGNGDTREKESVTLSILDNAGTYTLLPCDNDILLGAPDIASRGYDHPETVAAVIASGLPEIASLIKPVFFQDEARTLFLEPSLTELTVERWEHWAVPHPSVGNDPGAWMEGALWKEVTRPSVPRGDDLITEHGDQRLVLPQEPYAIIAFEGEKDWLTSPVTVLSIDDTLIGPGGYTGLSTLSPSEIAEAMAEGFRSVPVQPASVVPPGGVVVAAAGWKPEQEGLTTQASGLAVIGGAGVNAALFLALRAGVSGGKLAPTTHAPSGH